MRFILLILITGIGFFTSYAHDSKEAYFEIYETENAILIKAEFPWTIRKAVFHFRPELETTKSKKTIEDALFDYIQSNLHLTTKEGRNITLTRITEVDVDGHSHQANYLFTFEKDALFQVENQILFAVNDKQVNYHSVRLNDTIAEFTTSKKITTFNIEQKSEAKSSVLWLLIPVALILAILSYQKYKKCSLLI